MNRNKITIGILSLFLIAFAIGISGAITEARPLAIDQQNIYYNNTNTRTSGLISDFEAAAVILETNTNDVFMKISGIDGVGVGEEQKNHFDIWGYYDQLNYFNLPITVELVNKYNHPIKYRNVTISIYEYAEKGYYRNVYHKKVKTSASGKVDFLFSYPYKGYPRSRFDILIGYDDPYSNKYALYERFIQTNWYIQSSTAGKFPEKYQKLFENK